jgi:hypothetical protein
MADTTTVHIAEVVRYDDPVIITERVAVAAFIAGYTDPTRRSYATDLRIFAGWCHVNRPGFSGGSDYWFPTSSWSVLRAA